MDTIKKVLVVIGLIGAPVVSFFIGQSIGEFYWNHVVVKAFDVEKI